jgi:hypothetical protein
LPFKISHKLCILQRVSGALWTEDRSVMSPLPTQGNTNTGRAQTYVHAQNGIQTHDPSFRVDKDVSCLIQRGHPNLQLVLNQALTTSNEGNGRKFLTVYNSGQVWTKCNSVTGNAPALCLVSELDVGNHSDRQTGWTDCVCVKCATFNRDINKAGGQQKRDQPLLQINWCDCKERSHCLPCLMFYGLLKQYRTVATCFLIDAATFFIALHKGWWFFFKRVSFWRQL